MNEFIKNVEELNTMINNTDMNKIDKVIYEQIMQKFIDRLYDYNLIIDDGAETDIIILKSVFVSLVDNDNFIIMDDRYDTNMNFISDCIVRIKDYDLFVCVVNKFFNNDTFKIVLLESIKERYFPLKRVLNRFPVSKINYLNDDLDKKINFLRGHYTCDDINHILKNMEEYDYHDNIYKESFEEILNTLTFNDTKPAKN